MLFSELLPFFILIVGATLCSCLTTFNAETARHTQNNLQEFLSTTNIPIAQIDNAFASGLINLVSDDSSDRLRKLLFTQISSFHVGSRFMVAINDGAIFQEFQQEGQAKHFLLNNGSALCAQANNEVCLGTYSLDVLGLPNIPPLSAKLVSLQSTQYAWYGAAMANGNAWSAPFMDRDSGSAFITHSRKIKNTLGNIIGAAGVAIALTQIDKLLSSIASNNNVIFVMEHESKLLLSASLQNVTTTLVNGIPQLLSALTCSNDIIRRVSNFVISVENQTTAENILYIHNDLYIQTKPLYLPAGINWDIVVARPADYHDAFIATASVPFIILCIVAALCMVVTAALMMWVVWFREMNIWKIAQPSALLMILLSNAMCVSSVYVLIGPPSNTICLARQWILCLSITFTCAAFLAKVLRVYAVVSTKTAIAERNAKLFPSAKKESNTLQSIRLWLFNEAHAAMVVLAVLAVQVVLLGIWTAVDPLSPVMKYEHQEGDVLIAYEVCVTQHIWGFAACGSVIALLFLAGGPLSFLTRGFSEMFAESRSLMLTFYHGAILCILILCVALFAHPTTYSVLLLITIFLVWFTAVTQVVLFAPRISRQLTIGDFSVWEMRDIVTSHQHNHGRQESENDFLPGHGTPGSVARRIHHDAHAQPRVTFGNQAPLISSATSSERDHALASTAPRTQFVI